MVPSNLLIVLIESLSLAEINSCAFNNEINSKNLLGSTTIFTHQLLEAICCTCAVIAYITYVASWKQKPFRHTGAYLLDA